MHRDSGSVQYLSASGVRACETAASRAEAASRMGATKAGFLGTVPWTGPGSRGSRGGGARAPAPPWRPRARAPRRRRRGGSGGAEAAHPPRSSSLSGSRRREAAPPFQGRVRCLDAFRSVVSPPHLSLFPVFFAPNPVCWLCERWDVQKLRVFAS